MLPIIANWTLAIRNYGVFPLQKDQSSFFVSLYLHPSCFIYRKEGQNVRPAPMFWLNFQWILFPRLSSSYPYVQPQSGSQHVSLIGRSTDVLSGVSISVIVPACRRSLVASPV